MGPQRNQAPHSVTNPTGVEYPATGYTALHTILRHGLHLETVQVTGNTALTDSCLEQIIAKNPLSELRRLVISSPSSQEEMVMVPLTTRSVLSSPPVSWGPQALGSDPCTERTNHQYVD